MAAVPKAPDRSPPRIAVPTSAADQCDPKTDRQLLSGKVAGRLSPNCGRSGTPKPIAAALWDRRSRRMTWKRLALAFLLASIAIPTGFFASEAVLARWYEHTEARSHDGQIGLSIIFGSVFDALVCGALTFVIALFWRRPRR